MMSWAKEQRLRESIAGSLEEAADSLTYTAKILRDDPYTQVTFDQTLLNLAALNRAWRRIKEGTLERAEEILQRVSW